MKLIVCLDDRLGMAFNSRRQSRDRKLLDDLCAHVGQAPLYMLPYSLPLFEGTTASVSVSKDLSSLPKDAYVFLETTDPTPLSSFLDEVILYRWNRHYPADLVFPIDLGSFTLTSTTEFSGSSHDTITKEVWKK